MSEQANLQLEITGDARGAQAALNGTTASLQKMAKATPQATFALTSLTRVVQDAPFGFIAVQNNIDQLLVSFQTLAQSSGSGSAAIKQLLQSFVGFGGVSFLVSAGISAYTSFLINSQKENKNAKKTVDELAEAIKTLVKPIGDITSSAIGGEQGEIAKVAALTNVIRDNTSSKFEQKRAVEELKRVSEAYFGTLDSEKINLEQLTKAQDEFARSIVATAILKSLESEIGKVGAELFKQQQAIKESQAANQGLTNEIQNSNQALIDSNNAIGARTFFLDDQSRKLTEGTNAVKVQTKALKPLQDQYSTLQKAIQGAVDQVLKFKNPDIKPKEVKAEVDKITLKPATIEIAPESIPEAIKKFLSKQAEELGNLVQNTGLTQPVNISSIIDTSGIPAKQKLVEQSIDGLKELQREAFLTNQVLSPIADTFANIFQEMITGSQNAIQAVIQGLKQLVAQLVATVVKAAVLAGLLSIIFPGGAGINGIKGFGNLFKSLLGFGPKLFATGGIVSGPTNAIVGEAGPEAIIPLNRLFGLIQNNGSGRPRYGVARGTDIVFAFEETKRQQGRLFR